LWIWDQYASWSTNWPSGAHLLAYMQLIEFIISGASVAGDGEYLSISFLAFGTVLTEWIGALLSSCSSLHSLSKAVLETLFRY